MVHSELLLTDSLPCVNLNWFQNSNSGDTHSTKEVSSGIYEIGKTIEKIPFSKIILSIRVFLLWFLLLMSPLTNLNSNFLQLRRVNSSMILIHANHVRSTYNEQKSIGIKLNVWLLPQKSTFSTFLRCLRIFTPRISKLDSTRPASSLLMPSRAAPNAQFLPSSFFFWEGKLRCATLTEG